MVLGDIKANKELPNAKWEEGAFFVVAFSPDSKLLAAGEGCAFIGEPSHGEIRIWETDTGKLRFQLQAHDKAIQSLTFSPDGKALVSGGVDGVVKWWDHAKAQEVDHLNVRRGDRLGMARSDYVFGLLARRECLGYRKLESRRREGRSLALGYEGRQEAFDTLSGARNADQRVGLRP